MGGRVPNKATGLLYGEFTWLWPIMSPPGDYTAESTFFARLIKRQSGGRARTLLHLGCGGGSNDFTLKRHFSVTGVDISVGMLELARQLNSGATYHQGDMRSVRLERTFDAVVCLDAIAYMTSQADLVAAFRTASAHLQPGGLFLTFVEETPETLHQNRTVHSTHRSASVDLVVIENIYDPEPDDTTFEVTFVYLIRQSGVLTTHVDQHVCGLFSMDTWVESIMQAGFEEPRLFSSGNLVSPAGRKLPVLLARKLQS